MLQYKVDRPNFDEAEHPRDRLGRFIEINAHVSIWGGATGTVVRNVGGGRLEIERDGDGQRVIVHRNYLTVLRRPDGGKPSDKPATAVAAPVRQASDDAEEIAPEGSHHSEDEIAHDDLSPNDSGGSSAGKVDEDAKPVYGGGTELSDSVDQEPTMSDLQALAEAPTPFSAMAAVEDAHAHNVVGADDVIEHEPGADEIEPAGTVYHFPAAFDEAAIASIEAANRRAEKAGVDGRFTYEITHTERTVTDRETGIDHVVVDSTLTLNRPTVMHDGWTFAATLTWDPEAGLITRTVPDAVLQKRPEARHCDVCNSQRDRKDTYVVQKGDQELQVGSNCLNQFMGIRPAGLWMLGFEPDFPDTDPDEIGGGIRGGEERTSSQEVLAWTLAIAGDQGWVSRGAAQADWSKEATADLVMTALYDRGKMGRELRDRYSKAAAENRPDALALLDFARGIEGDNDYITNLRALAGPESVTRRNIPLLASAFAAKRAREEKIAKDEAAKQTASVSKPVGKPKDKIADVKARVLSVRVMEGDYGPRTLFTFQDSDGNILKWWASGAKDDLAAVNDEVTIAGTIKGHGEYRGVAETNLLRVKIKRSDAAVKAEEERRAAVLKAEQEREAEQARLGEFNRTAVPEGYTKYDGESPLPVGTTVRARAFNLYGYRNGVIASDIYEVGNRRMVYVVQPQEHSSAPVSTGLPLDQIEAIAPEVDQDIEGGRLMVEDFNRHSAHPVDMQIAAWRYKGTSSPDGYGQYASEVLHIGTTIRVKYNGGYVNVPIVKVTEGTDDPTVIARYPDGQERQVPMGVRGITAYKP